MPEKPSLMEKVSRGATPYLGSARPPCHTSFLPSFLPFSFFLSFFLSSVLELGSVFFALLAIPQSESVVFMHVHKDNKYSYIIFDVHEETSESKSESKLFH
jgi:hypothetical protein